MSVPADIDGDGNQEILMTTMDPGNVSQLTSPTPVYILGTAEGQVIDRSAELFGGTTPTMWSGKLLAADFDGDGAMDVMTCDRGRSAGPQPIWNQPLPEGVWSAQTQIFLQRSGVLVDYTSAYPRVIHSCNGASAGNIDGSGKATIVSNNWRKVPDWMAAYLLRWNGAAFDVVLNLTNQDQGWGWTETADFDLNGFADVVGLESGKVLWGGGPGLEGVRPLEPSVVQRAGYTFWRGTLSGDFTGDGYPDLITTSSLGGPTLAGTRFALYAGGPNRTLAEKVDAFPAIATYNASDFGHLLTSLDVNFDGFTDIAMFGNVYTFNSPQRPPTAVWLNDGTGRFTLARWSDQLESSCQLETLWQAYFLKTPDPKAFNLVVGGCGKQYFTRTVTEASPLTFLP